jgi:hypothetical protein
LRACVRLRALACACVRLRALACACVRLRALACACVLACLLACFACVRACVRARAVDDWLAEVRGLLFLDHPGDAGTLPTAGETRQVEEGGGGNVGLSAPVAVSC